MTTSNLHLDFQLRPVSDITAFGREHPHLHWFGLTDGWYWLQIGDVQLFRYSDALMVHEEPWHSAPGTLPYVDYYVTRLWEDLLDLLPKILAPVPDAVAHRLASAVQWETWEERLEKWIQRQESDDAIEMYERATHWWNERHLDTHYLRYGPRIAFWRVGEVMHVRWDNRGQVHDGYPVWSAVSGEGALPLMIFLDALQSFDRRFITAMAERINQVRVRRPDPRINLDITQIEREQQDRAHWFERGIAAISPGVTMSWDDSVSAIAQLEDAISREPEV